ncbi:MAG: hypothetical protein BRC27_01785, partial [Nanohaloarchaea archaeon SW_10_44_10]
YRSGSDTINLTLRNVGDRTIDLTNETTMLYQPGDEQEPLQRDQLFSIYPEWDSGNSDNCLQNDRFNPGDQLTCDTGVNFPNASQQMRVIVDYRQIDSESYSYLCDPQTSSTSTC